MTEEIVACPGCAKKFRIPEGAESGSFACTACGVDVPYGAAARKPVAAARGVASRPAARPSAPPPPARSAPAARPAAAAGSRRSTREAPSHAAHGRHQGRDEAEAPKSSHQGAIWGGIVAVAIIGLGLVYVMTKKSPPPAPPATATASKPPEAPKPVPVNAPETPKPEPTKPPVIESKPTPAASGGEPATTKPAESKTDVPDPKKPEASPAKPSTSQRGDNSVLGQTFASVAGVTPEERADLDRLVGLAMDRNSGKEGSNAEATIIRKGKKSIPSLLSAFSKQYTTGKWGTDEEQWSADKIQDLLHQITGADRIQPDYWPKFMSGASPADFEKAANMWISWWTRAQFKEKFRRGDEK